MARVRRISDLSDAELARRYQELHYRMIECAIAPDHPSTVANQARWKREFKQVEQACERRQMFADQHGEES